MRAWDDLDLSCDLRTEPWRYPGPWASGSGLITDARLHRLRLVGHAPLGQASVSATAVGGDLSDELGLDEALTRLGVVPTASRHRVLSVGANACPGILETKFLRGGVSVVTPLFSVRISGIAVGHSAHVAHGTYIPATPFVAPGSVTDMWLILVDDDQLDCLDATEPNYVRTTISADMFPMSVTGPGVEHKLAAAEVYTSVFGVLTDENGPVLLTGQAELTARLLRAHQM